MVAGARHIAKKNEKLAQTLAGQQGWQQRLATQLAQRDSQRPLVWFHVASAGEYLQAAPVMERLMRANYQCVLTITSVSGYRWASKRPPQPNLIAIEYYPLDNLANVRWLLEHIQPDLLVYVKFDLWPNLVWEARRQGVKQILISATLQPKSQRIASPLGRQFYRSIYNNLDAILTVSDADTQRFLRTNPQHPHVQTVGDTRFDSVLDRRDSLTPPKLPDWVSQQPVLVLGSIWPEDEACIIPALHAALARFPQLVIIAAPHEVDAAHLAALEQAFAGHRLLRLSQIRPDSPPQHIILVDSVGQLSALYYYADLAYVGGAFGKGVHNVMEPSALGVPAIFGPGYQNSPEAVQLISQGQAYSIHDRAEFESLIMDLLDHAERREHIGQQAAAYIESKAGASAACFDLIKEMIHAHASAA